jgi:hypothetical protein
MSTTYLNQNLKSNFIYLALFLCCCFNQIATAQVTGDYRSIATGNWSATTTWQYYNGAAWIAATKYPGQISGDKTVTIRSPHTVTWNLAATPFQVQNITVDLGATLQDLGGAFSYHLSPTSLISVSGTMNLTNTSDVTSSLTGGNLNITSTGLLSAHKIVVLNNDNSGVATITDEIGAASGYNWYNLSGGVLNFGGSSIVASLFTNFSNNTVNYYSATANQTIASPADGSYFNLTLSGAGGKTKTLSAATLVFGSVSIQNNSVFSLGGFDLSVAGDWNNSSTATLAGTTNTTVTFLGSDPQNIINSGGATDTFFYNLTINNSSATSPQITFYGNVFTRIALTMLAGNVDLNGNTLYLGYNFTDPITINHSGLASAGWVYNGFFRWYLQDGVVIPNGSTKGLFPVGTSTDFRPLYLSCPVVAPTSASVLIKCNGASNTTIVNIADTGGPIVRQHQGYWQMISSVATGSFNINAGGTGFGVVANVNDLRLSLAASVIGSAGTNSGTNSFPLVQRTGLSPGDLTNNFYMASVEPVGSYLPVSLVSFTGKANASKVDLEWTTNSELNSYKFIVLRSANGSEFSPIGSVEGQGTTKKMRTYSLVDSNPFKGKNYYRLEQLDNDLKSAILKTIVVEINSIEPVKIYPNPVNEGDAINVDLNGLAPNSEKEIQIADLRGNLVSTQIITTDESGGFRGELRVQHLTSGLYILNLDDVKSRIYIR